MSCEVNFSSPLWKYSKNVQKVNVEGATIRDVFKGLEEMLPGLNRILLNDDGNPRSSIKVYLNNDDIEMLKRMDTNVPNGTQIFITPILTGG